ncbi:hypothetical protein DOY81_004783 [Sarcophaga bullata]|nr:hypothetical protein DOY81_004783 [Sarcophaga bullata]
MFSGGDSSEGLNQLGAYGFVNQVAVSNAMAAGQNIDWAQLAQQWIQMRDNAGLNTETACNLGNSKMVQPASVSNFEEKGEADMDMDEEEQQTDEKLLQKVDNSFSSSTGLNHNTLNQSWFFNDGTSSKLTTQSSNTNQWNSWPNRESLQHQPPSNSSTSNILNRPINSTSHIPSLLKMNVPHPNEIRIMPDMPNQPETGSNMMDAAKRKGLPAWIREGLEKMEREKQKQLEREQQTKQSSNKWSDNESDKTRGILSKTHIIANCEEGNLDEESSDNETGVQNVEANAKNNLNLRNDEEDAFSVPVGKTYEQKLADLMIVVRRTLTELLLETTNEEIAKVAEESIKSFKTKASSAQVIQKSALSTITGKLGLAVYGGSSSEETTDDDEQSSSKKETYQSESENDSEEELRNIIRMKRRVFVKTAEEIEERVSSAAAREEEKLKYFIRKEEEEDREKNRKKLERPVLYELKPSGLSLKGYEKDFGEITETKIQNLNGKRQRDRNSRRGERTTRFSDNKDKYVALPATASYVANINATGSTSSGSTATVAISSTNQRQSIADINGLLPNYTSAGMTNVLNAADAALEKVLKRKSPSSLIKQSRRHDRNRDYRPSKKRQRRSCSRKSRSRSKSNSSTSSSSSSSSTSSSDSDSSPTSRSSHHSKYSHRSVAEHKSHKSFNKKYEKSQKNHKDQHKYSSSHSKDSESRSGQQSRRYRHNASSDSGDDYSHRRRRDSHFSRHSSHTHRYTSSRRDRENSRSLSRSSYSSSSNRRQ